MRSVRGLRASIAISMAIAASGGFSVAAAPPAREELTIKPTPAAPKPSRTKERDVQRMSAAEDKRRRRDEKRAAAMARGGFAKAKFHSTSAA